ncbi:hypothetical protein MMYC01_203526, partial [Madurella mycetomatis]
YYTLRTTNTLPHDTALSITHIPSRHLTYALFLGFSDRQTDAILKRLEYSPHAALDPFTLINAFIQLEKVVRFEQVEKHADEMANLIRNFQLQGTSKGEEGRARGHDDDPRNLVGLAGEMGLLQNGLVS